MAYSHSACSYFCKPAGATSYTIQIYRGSLLYGTHTVTASTYQPSTNLPAGSYHWRVRCNGLNGPSGWSDSWNLTISP